MDASQKDALIARIKEKINGIDAAQPSTLRDLYEGKVFPADISYADVPEYKVLAKRLSDANASVESAISGSDVLEEAFEAYRDASGDMMELIAREQFTECFALAVRLITESLQY